MDVHLEHIGDITMGGGNIKFSGNKQFKIEKTNFRILIRRIILCISQLFIQLIIDTFTKNEQSSDTYHNPSIHVSMISSFFTTKYQQIYFYTHFLSQSSVNSSKYFRQNEVKKLRLYKFRVYLRINIIHFQVLLRYKFTQMSGSFREITTDP